MNVEPVCVCNVRIFTVWVAAILLTIWIITLTWLVIVLHNEIERLDSAVRQGEINPLFPRKLDHNYFMYSVQFN